MKNFVIFSLFIFSTIINFAQSDSYIYITYPRGTESFNVNDTLEIEWSYEGITSFDILLVDSENNETILAKEINAKNNKQKFVVNDNFPTLFKLKVVESDTYKVLDISPYFLQKNKIHQIVPKHSLTTNTSTSLKIMPLGDSITEGYMTGLTIRNGYRKPLKAKLDSNGLDIDLVGSEVDGDFMDNEHEGHGGWHAKHWFGNTSYSIAAHLTEYLNQNHPNIVLFHLGTNDIGEYDDSRNDNTIDTTVADISGLLDTIYTFDPNVKVILAKITNRIDKISTPNLNENDTTTAFNTLLEQMAFNRISNGDNLYLVDMESALIYPDDLSDSTHPNEVGYNKMANVWLEAIKQVLPKYSVRVFLEGAYLNGYTMNSSLNIPLGQPFNISPWNYTGGETIQSIPTNVIDWVLVSLRDTSTHTISKRAAFINNDGYLVDLDGSSPIVFPVLQGNYYFVVEHRNHISIMSSTQIN